MSRPLRFLPLIVLLGFVIAVAWRSDGLILPAIKIPKPSPIAVRVRTSNGATGRSSELFGMDMREDIAYHIRRVSEKETAIFATRSALHRHA